MKNKYFIRNKNRAIRNNITNNINSYIQFRKNRNVIINNYDNMDIKNIVFFHEHVNGDCYFSRIFVKSVIDGTKDSNINYYYNSYRSLSSHCKDLGIMDENFNTNFSNINYSLKHYKINDTLYLNVWLGLNNKYPICVMCMKNYSLYYNDFINEINENYKLNISLIDTNHVEQFFIGFDYNLYKTDYLNNYIRVKKNTYSKIILVYNCRVSSYLSLNDINHNYYLNKISSQYPEYFFITFASSGLIKENIKSFSEIYNECFNSQVNSSYGIDFSYLSNIVDKVIMLMSGVSQLCYSSLNLNDKNKFLMFITNNNISNCPVCSFSDDNLLCCSNYNLFINTLLVDNSSDSEYIYNNINEFIQK
jgi:hypothetical protein